MSIMLRAFALFLAFTSAATLEIADSCALLQSNLGIGVVSAPEKSVEGSEVYNPAGGLLMLAQEALENESTLMVNAIHLLSSTWPNQIGTFLTGTVQQCSPDLWASVVTFGHDFKGTIGSQIGLLSSIIEKNWNETIKLWNDTVEHKNLVEKKLPAMGSPANAADPRKAYVDGFIQANNRSLTKMLEQNLTALKMVAGMHKPVQRAYDETKSKLLDRKLHQIHRKCMMFAEKIAISTALLYETLHNATLAVSSEIFRFNARLHSISRLAYETPTMMSPMDKLRSMHSALSDEVDKHVPVMLAAFDMVNREEEESEEGESQDDKESEDDEESEDEDEDEEADGDE